MPRPTPTLLATLVLAGLLPAAGLRAQLTEGTLSPGGRLRLELAPSFDLWDRRFGSHVFDGALVEGEEPLGWDLENAPLLRLEPLAEELRAAVGDPGIQLGLGSTRALVLRDRTGISFGAALGLFDWLTVGVRAPLVKARTEVAVDFRGGADDVGLNPRLGEDPGAVDAFLAELGGSRAALAAHVAQSCPGAADCDALASLLDRYSTFVDGMGRAYVSSPLFVAQGSLHAVNLGVWLARVREEIAALGASLPLPGDPPLAASPLDQDQLERLLTDPGFGYQLLQPLDTDASFWQLGDVEVSVALRLLEGAVRDSAGAPARFRYLLGAQGLARLPTGHPDSPDLPLDLGSGDGQLDLEAGGFAELRWSRLGLRGAARWGVQRATDLIRRVAPPEEPFAPFATRTLVRWTPGDYWALQVEPAWYLTDELSVGALLRRSSKAADRYETVGGADPDPASVLELETESTLQEVGLGVGFSTLAGWQEGRASLPFEIRLAVRRGVSGSGNVPAGTSMEASGRLFWRLWGDDPAAAGSP